MATVVLNVYSKAYPFIVNRIMASVYLQTDPQALIATLIDSNAGHPARTWSFPGLPRNNYGFSLDEIDGSGVKTGTNLALFDVVPGEIEGQLTRDDEQIKVGYTTGFNAGDNTFTFDGTGDKPNYIGWTIVPSELTGRGILVNGLDYSWNSITGQLILLQSGDVFALDTVWNIHFNPQINQAGGSQPTIIDFQTLLYTTSQDIPSDAFGKKLVIELTGIYGEFNLPDILTVPQGRKLMVELGGTGYCAKFVPFGSNTINFARGELRALPQEKFSIYKFTRSVGVHEWRVDDTFGNFLSCGEEVSHDLLQVKLYNLQSHDGTVYLKNSIAARVYNEVVLQLPNTQVCNFDVWSTGNNKYLFSLANSSNPTNANKFHFPDRRGLYERANLAGKSGDHIDSMVGPHGHEIVGIKEGTDGTPTGYTIRPIGSDPGTGSGQGGLLTIPDAILVNDGTETRPESYLKNKYILL